MLFRSNLLILCHRFASRYLKTIESMAAIQPSVSISLADLRLMLTAQRSRRQLLILTDHGCSVGSNEVSACIPVKGIWLCCMTLMRSRRASFTELALGNISATSGSKRTVVQPKLFRWYRDLLACAFKLP